MELNKYYKPICIILAVGVFLSWIFKLDLLFYLLIIILVGLSFGRYDYEKGKSGFFWAYLD